MTKDQKMGAQLSLLGAMILFGTIGIFRKYIPLPSGMLAMARGLIGAAFLLVFIYARGGRVSREAVGKNTRVLVLSGACIGVNWILLFEAYRYTSVAVATLCYYMAPIFVILASPFLLGERISVRKGICVAAALAGMVLVSGVVGTGVSGAGELRGVALGIGAAALYATVILLNKRLHGISAFDRTVVQLAVAGGVLVPYVLLTGEMTGVSVTAFAVVMLAVVGIIHTGIAYAMYFGSIEHIKAQTVALLSYVDPIVALMLSALVLGEKMDIWQMIGAALVLCATIISELPEHEKKERR